MLELTRSEARRMRLVAHGLDRASRTSGDASAAAGVIAGDAAGAAGCTPVEVVHRMVAMQGQDLPQVLRAIAIRSAPGTTLADVRAAFDRGELVRSWAMRGTLFVSTPQDLAVLHAAVAPRMRRQEWRMCTDRDIDEAIAARAAQVLVEHLADRPRSRPSLLAVWESAGVETGGGRGYHLLALLAYDELVRFGPFDGEAQLLVGGPPAAVSGAERLVDELVDAELVDAEAAFDDALRRFVLARGPVSADDAAWWLGLPKTLVRASLARARGLNRVLVGGTEMLIGEDASGSSSGVHLVPGFDEWILGYRDRSITAGPAMTQALVPGNNGVFKPAVLIDGRTVGTWRWPPQRGTRPVEPVLQIVEDVTASTRARIERALARWPHR
ncbi:winged helix DNA-binding domain-containing protein [Agrococcus sp. KRD186]|uniref:winged helix DNA-binding domain-containing protein n=1 Tax=Agrococcus sp. KRD186 TaxID=2729730 RepID=UPI0019D1747C|nr:winged helix DNA-binding domain-containing protein [Agrococcus sp. KRD186]